MLVVLAVSVAVAIGLVLAPGRTPAAHAAFLRRTGLTFVCVSTALIGLSVIGETFASPGGWRAAGLTSLWLAPMGGLSALAWARPRWAAPTLAALGAAVAGAAVVALAAWPAADPAWWRVLEDRSGPVWALAAFALALPVGLLGWRRTRLGGALLLALGLAPAAAAGANAAAGAGMAAASVAAVSAPAALTGLLYLGAEMAGRRGGSGPGRGAAPPGAAGLAGRG